MKPTEEQKKLSIQIVKQWQNTVPIGRYGILPYSEFLEEGLAEAISSAQAKGEEIGYKRALKEKQT